MRCWAVLLASATCAAALRGCVPFEWRAVGRTRARSTVLAAVKPPIGPQQGGGFESSDSDGKNEDETTSDLDADAIAPDLAAAYDAGEINPEIAALLAIARATRGMPKEKPPFLPFLRDGFEYVEFDFSDDPPEDEDGKVEGGEEKTEDVDAGTAAGWIDDEVADELKKAFDGLRLDDVRSPTGGAGAPGHARSARANMREARRAAHRGRPLPSPLWVLLSAWKARVPPGGSERLHARTGGTWVCAGYSLGTRHAQRTQNTEG